MCRMYIRSITMTSASAKGLSQAQHDHAQYMRCLSMQTEVLLRSTPSSQAGQHDLAYL